MKNTFTILFLLASLTANAIAYTSSGSGDWLNAGIWNPTGPPGSGSPGNNIINIQPGHSITISGDAINLSNIVINIHGRLIMDNAGFSYANLNLTGANSGVVIHPGGTIQESAILDGFLNIRVNGTVVWNGSSNGTITAGSSPIFLPIALPIELINWKVTATKHGVTAFWATASETDNDFFTIEESKDGIDFYSVSQINGKGNSNTLQEYQYTFTPLNTGTLYYRLKQTDFNGDYTYSTIISTITIDQEESISVFPNPITQKTFSIYTGTKRVSTITLTNLQSSEDVFYQTFSYSNLSMISIDLPVKIKAGVYLLKITHAEGIETKSVIIY